jgi:hypothetical protein
LADVNIQLSYCHAKLALLLHISQTRFGAAAIFNAGLFHSVRVSELFATDPDLGVGRYPPSCLDSYSNVSRHCGPRRDQQTLRFASSNHEDNLCCSVESRISTPTDARTRSKIFD